MPSISPTASPTAALAAGSTTPPPAAGGASTPAVPTGTSTTPGGAVAPQHAGRGAFLRGLPPAQQQAVRSAYDQSRLYHGTSTAGKASIQQHGFDRSRKAGGATETVAAMVPAEFLANANGHNYLTGNYGLAQSYAATGRGTPALVRTVLDHGAAGLEDDPDSMPQDRALRTAQNIPAGNILQSKTRGNHELSDAANRHFQQELGNRGLNVSAAQARELLADVQSDSDDDDFTHVRGMGVG